LEANRNTCLPHHANSNEIEISQQSFNPTPPRKLSDGFERDTNRYNLSHNHKTVEVTDSIKHQNDSATNLDKRVSSISANHYHHDSIKYDNEKFVDPIVTQAVTSTSQKSQYQSKWFGFS